jgi:hypothetical protein
VARVVVVLPDPAGEALTALADREWRRPSEQAGYLITEALRQRGALPPTRVAAGGEDDPPAPQTAA